MDKTKLTLFLNVKGQEVKKILELKDFEEPIEVELIQSINGKQGLLHASKIKKNSFTAANPVVDDDEFIEATNALYEDETTHEEEVEKQAEIEKEFIAAEAEQDRKGREKAARLQAEENKRLQDAKRELETSRYQKRTTVSTKKSTK